MSTNWKNEYERNICSQEKQVIQGTRAFRTGTCTSRRSKLPDYVRVVVALTNAYHQTGCSEQAFPPLEKAIEACEKLIDESPNRRRFSDLVSLRALGLALSDADAARLQLESEIQRISRWDDPSLLTVPWEGLGDICIALGDDNGALGYISKAFENRIASKDDPEAIDIDAERLISLYEERGDLVNAERIRARREEARLEAVRSTGTPEALARISEYNELSKRLAALKSEPILEDAIDAALEGCFSARQTPVLW